MDDTELDTVSSKYRRGEHMSNDKSGKREYSGGAVNTFVLGLAQSQGVINKILSDVGISKLDPNAWYDFELAERVFLEAQKALGRAAVRQCGKLMIESAEYPPEINSVKTLLAGLGQWYSYHARGPNVGTITCEFEDEQSATLDWSTGRFPCAFCMGILEGAAARYGVKPLIEHGNDGCRDTGASTCIYHVNW